MIQDLGNPMPSAGLNGDYACKWYIDKQNSILYNLQKKFFRHAFKRMLCMQVPEYRRVYGNPNILMLSISFDNSTLYYYSLTRWNWLGRFILSTSRPRLLWLWTRWNSKLNDKQTQYWKITINKTKVSSGLDSHKSNGELFKHWKIFKLFRWHKVKMLNGSLVL